MRFSFLTKVFSLLSASIILTGCNNLNVKNKVDLSKEGFFVSGVSPEQGPPGSEVVISGEAFSEKTQIQFSGTELIAVSKDRNRIRFIVPQSSTSGVNNIVVEDQGSAVNILFFVTDGSSEEKNSSEADGSNDLPKNLEDKYVEIAKLDLGAFSIKNSEATIADNTPDIQWQGTINAAGFNLTLTSDPQCENAIFTLENITTTETTLSAPLPDGTYYICVVAFNAAGAKKKAENNGVRLTIDTVFPTSIINNPPKAVSNSLQHVMTISGPMVESYVYKFGPKQFVHCDQLFGYSDFVNTSQSLVVDQSSHADGDYKLCVLGISPNGVMQPPNLATATEWKKDTQAPPMLVGFSQVLPFRLGKIKLDLKLPADLSDYKELKIYESVGPAASACGSGTIVHSMTDFSSSPPVELNWDVDKNIAKNFRVCIADNSGNIQSNNSLQNIKANHQRIFTTSATYNGDLKATFMGVPFHSGVQGGAYRCQYLADQAGLEGKFEALLGRTVYKGNGNGAGSAWFPHYDNTVYNIKETQIISNRTSDFWSSNHLSEIIYDENGNDLSSSSTIKAWMSINAAGSPYSNDCNGWSSTISSGYVGFINMKDFKWASGYDPVTTFYLSCSQPARLYCLEVLPKPAALTSFSASGTDGAVSVTVDFPDDSSSIGRVDIIRFGAGEKDTNLDCLSSAPGYQLLKSYDGNGTPFTDGTFIDTGSFGTIRKFTYQACVYDKSGFRRHVQEIASPILGGSNPYQTLFLTENSYSPNFGGLAGADGLCQSLADGAGLGGGSYRAILSDSATNAADRITVSGMVLDTMGRKIADDHADLFDGTIDNYILYTENVTYSYYYVHTGSDGFGMSTGQNCSDWTSTSSGLTSTQGYSGFSSSSWLYYSSANYSCSTYFRLYCISGQ